VACHCLWLHLFCILPKLLPSTLFGFFVGKGYLIFISLRTCLWKILCTGQRCLFRLSRGSCLSTCTYMCPSTYLYSRTKHDVYQLLGLIFQLNTYLYMHATGLEYRENREAFLPREGRRRRKQERRRKEKENEASSHLVRRDHHRFGSTIAKQGTSSSAHPTQTKPIP
jgi:hypothetical protein